MQIAFLGSSGIPSVEAIFNLHDQKLQLVATHPLPPGSRSNALERNQHLEAVAKHLAKLSTPKLLVGDLNITPWSPYFGDLLEVSQLQNSQRGFGVQPTWLGQIPIDHVLHSQDISVEDRRIGPRFGSDHQPIIVDLAIEKGAQ